MASKKIKGITIAIGADTSGVTAGLEGITKESVKVSNQLKQVESLLKLDPTNTELLAERERLLGESIDKTREKLRQLEAVQEDVNKQYQEGKIDTSQYIAYQNELVKTRDRLSGLEAKLDETGSEVTDLGKGMAESSDDTKKLGKSLDDVDSAAKKAGDGLKVAAVALGDFIGGLALDALKSAADGIKNLAADVVQSYGELEQSLGGSEAVFGQYAATIQREGEEAYRNLGISQSEYLAAANKMGALFQGAGFDQQESLNMTTEAMRRAADVASVMGIDTSAAMEAIAGAAKGNFTMMDNLGVAINDTTLQLYAQEKGLGKLETTQQKVSAAMALFMEQTQQYDGNFAREASETVSGSLGLMQASFDSLIAGIGNSDADIENLVGNVADSVEAAFSNIAPVVENAVSALPVIVSEISKSAVKMLPQVQKIVSNIGAIVWDGISSLSGIFTDLISGFIASMPKMMQTGITVVKSLASGISSALPELIPLAALAITSMVKELAMQIPQVVDVALDIIDGLVDGILSALPFVISAMPEIINGIIGGLFSRIDDIITAGVDLLTAIIDDLPHIIDVIVAAVPFIISSLEKTLINNSPKIMDAGFKLITAVISDLPHIIATVITAIPPLVAGITNELAKNFPALAEAGFDAFMQLTKNIGEVFRNIRDASAQIVLNIVDSLRSKAGDLWNMGVDLFNNVANGIRHVIGSAWDWGMDLIQNFVNGITGNIWRVTQGVEKVAERIKSLIAFSEPEDGPLSNFHTYAPDMMKLFAQGIKENEDLIARQFDDALSKIGVAADITALQAPAVSAVPTVANAAPVTLNVNVSVDSISSNYGVDRMTDRMVENISAGLASLSSRQAALIGG